MRFIVEALNVAEDRICYATFTGKAAEVLRKKGNSNAMTLHKLLYTSVPKPGGGFFRKPKTYLEYDIIVVDECSMVPKYMIDILLKHKVYIIFLGDPFQLPQINKNESHDLLEKPHIFLSEIMRQAKESEIIRLTMDIREKKPLKLIKGNEVMILPKKEITTAHLLWADQVICGTNMTRHSLNNQMRTLLGFEGELQDNEKVIIKRNYWEDCNEDGDALVNGSSGIIKNVSKSFRRIPSFIQNDRHDLPVIIGDFTPEGSKTFYNIEFDRDFLTSETPCLDWRVSYQLGKLKNKIGDIIPRQMTYGYTITCHAAQGSEWDKVLVIEENYPFDTIEHARWLYTACTRSTSRLVLVTN